MNTVKQRILTGRRLFASYVEPVLLALIVALSCVACLYHLERPYLWQDEAQTALISETILERGLPYGTDQKNFFSQELGSEYGENYLWRWHPWLSFYLDAASLAIFGKNTFAARLPFALLGIGCVLMAWILARGLWRSPPAGLLAAFILATNIPFILFCRQARYYSLAAFLSLVGLYAYFRLLHNKKGSLLFLTLASALLVQTHYLYFGSLSLALGLHALLFQRRTLLKTILACTLGLAVNAPWFVWFLSMRYSEQYGGNLFNKDIFLQTVSSYWNDLWHCMSLDRFLYAVLVILVVALIRAWRKKSFDWNPDGWLSGIALLFFFGLFTIIALGVSNPAPFVRYILPVFAVWACIAGGLAAWSWRLAHPLCVVLLLAASINHVLWYNFNYELHNHFPGPIEGISTFLNQNARPDDVVAITYGDLPIKFYTDLRVVGGLTGEDLEPARNADWVIIRNTTVSDKDAKVRQYLLDNLDINRYQLISIPYPDTVYEDRPSMWAHLFGSAPAGTPNVFLLKRVR